MGVGAPGRQDPWWLATNLTAPRGEIVAVDDRRMAIEEPLRETKGCRFGLKLEWPQFRAPEYLARCTLLIGVALVLWTAVGQAVAKANPSVRVPCKRKGPRLSLRRVGIRYLQKIARLVMLSVRFIQQPLPQPQLRVSAWLQTAKATSGK